MIRYSQEANNKQIVRERLNMIKTSNITCFNGLMLPELIRVILREKRFWSEKCYLLYFLLITFISYFNYDISYNIELFDTNLAFY